MTVKVAKVIGLRAIAKHTPGPWKSVNVSSQGTAVYRRIDGLNGTHIGFAGAYKLHNSEIAEANARLIAAAPDLLEAAQLAVIELAYVAHAEVESNALPLLRAAIAKAEGKEAQR